MGDQLLQNEKIKEISCHFQERLKDNIQHLQKIFVISSDECSQLKQQVLAMKFYIDQRCADFAQLILDVNHKGESRELLKKLSDLMTLSELLNEDITFYKEKITEQETEIIQLKQDLSEKKQKLDKLLIDYEQLHNKLSQEAKQERWALEQKVKSYEQQLQNQEDFYLQQIFDFETKIKQLQNTISDLEIGRGSLIKTIQQKEELLKRQTNHYDTKLNEQKQYWQNKLFERTAELEQQAKDQTSQWEVKCKCIQNDFDIYKKNVIEQLEQQNQMIILKDKDFDRLKEQYDKIAEEFRLKEFYIKTHKDDSEKNTENLINQIEQLKELQIHLEQKVNHQQYEYNKLIQQNKDADLKNKKEAQKLQQVSNELEIQNQKNIELQKTLLHYQEFIVDIYKNTTSFLNLEVKTEDFSKMLQFSSEYVMMLIRQIQESKLELQELQNIFETSNLDMKSKLNKQCQINLQQEKIISNLEKKVNELQKNLFQINLQQQQQPITLEKAIEKQKQHHLAIQQLDDISVNNHKIQQSQSQKDFQGESEFKKEIQYYSQKIYKNQNTQTNEEQVEQEQEIIQNSNLQLESQKIMETEKVESQLLIKSQSHTQEEVEQIQQSSSNLIQSKEKQVSSLGNSFQLPLLMGIKEKETQEFSQKDLDISSIRSQDENSDVVDSIKLQQNLSNQSEKSQKSIQNQEQIKQIVINNPMQNSDLQIKTAKQSPAKSMKSNYQFIKEEDQNTIEFDQFAQQNELNQIGLNEIQNEKLEQNNTIDQSLLIQKSQNNFHYQKLKKLKGSERKKQSNQIKLKLETVISNLNSTKKTPDTAAQTFLPRFSCSTEIQTDWRLGTATYTTIPKSDDQEIQQKEVEQRTEKLYYKLLGQFQELEQENLKLHLIVEYYQKNQPPIKITQDSGNQVNLDQEIFEELLKLQKEVSNQQKQIFLLGVQIDELNEEIKGKNKEIEDLSDLISSQSDQTFALKNKIQKQETQIKELQDKQDLEQQNKAIQSQVQVIQKEDRVKIKHQSNTIIVKKEKKEIQRPSTPQKQDQVEELRLKVFQQEKIIRSLNLQLAKKEEQLQQKQNRQENQAQLVQLQSQNVEINDLKKQLESKTEQVGKCYTLIKYLENELENYKDNVNIFAKPKQQNNTERVIRSVQATFPQASVAVQKKLPLLQFDEMATNYSKSSYKKRNHSLYTNPFENYDMLKNAAKAYQGELLNENAIKFICLTLKEIFSKEPNVKRIPTPVTVVGDVHGQLYDVQELFMVGGKPPYTNYLFLGDYVDRGAHSVEVITLLSLLKVKFPNRVTLIRGNHETRGITQNYGFYMECQQKYGNTQAWEYFTDMFDYIPIACIVGTNLICVHGGLSPCIESVDEIENLNRFQEIPHEGAFTDIMWSDPDDEDTPGFKISPRGAGFVFGGQVLKEFLHFNNMTHLIRAHQLCNEGFNLKFDDKCITVWSAPNYLYRNRNQASILEIDEQGNKYFNIFSESPENMKKNLGKNQSMMFEAEKNYFI